MRHTNWHTLRCCRQGRLRETWDPLPQVISIRERMFREARADHHGTKFRRSNPCNSKFFREITMEIAGNACSLSCALENPSLSLNVVVRSSGDRVPSGSQAPFASCKLPTRTQLKYSNYSTQATSVRNTAMLGLQYIVQKQTLLMIRLLLVDSFMPLA